MINRTSFFQKLNERKAPIGVVGLGYVGLSLAVALAKKFRVIGYDVSSERISLLSQGIDPSKEITSGELASIEIQYTADSSVLQQTPFIIIAVPTPIDEKNTPDLTPLIEASKTIGKHLSKNSIVVFESTVYPGVTEEICGPELEDSSGLKAGFDFFLGYSPERINPGDRARTVTQVVKIVSGQTEETLDIIAEVYGAIVEKGVHRASSIRVAEAAKVIENAQRDINIAFVNELAMIFHKMGLDTREVLQAAETKWNFLPFRPGLVGGHCISVDPYYLTFKAKSVGHNPQTILSGRQLNDGMGRWVARKLVEILESQNQRVENTRILICGLTFKENVTDVRNSRVKDIIDELHKFKIEIVVYDPHVNKEVAEKEFGVPSATDQELIDFDGVIFAVAHDEFRNLASSDIAAMMRHQQAPLLDLKWLFNRDVIERAGMLYWAL